MLCAVGFVTVCRSAWALDPATADCLAASDASLKSGNEHRLRAERAQLLVCSSGTCPADIRNECIRRETAVNAAIPTIVFEVKDSAGNDLSAVRVTMDGEGSGVVSMAPAPVAIPSAATPAEPGPAVVPGPSALPAPTTSSRRRRGFYFRGALGVGAAAWAHPVSMSGAAFDFDLAFGGTVYPGLAVGGMIYSSQFSSPTYSYQGTSFRGVSVAFFSIGPFMDWYFDPTKGLHGEAALGFAAVQSGSEIGYGEAGSFMAGVGYDWWIGPQWSLGVLGRLQYVSGLVTDSKTLITSVLATATHY
jgi:hypothetical protein